MDHPTVQICAYHLSYPLLNNENQSALLNWSRKTYLKNKIFAIHANTALVHRLESMEIRPPSLPPHPYPIHRCIERGLIVCL